MPKVSVTRILSTPIEVVFNTIKDIESYHHFLPGVTSVKKIRDISDTEFIAEYELSMVKTFRYQILMTLVPQQEVSWVLHQGDLFKKNSGHWQLTAKGKKQTQVQYDLDVEFKMFVPSMIVSSLVKGQLPLVMDAFEKRMMEGNK
jgi:coenzyme Q-binding protein COQ10